MMARYYNYTLINNLEEWSDVQEFHFYAVTGNNV
jgi:hypothetical protein